MKKNELEALWEHLSFDLTDKVKHEVLKPTGRGGVCAARDYIQANALLTTAIKQGVNLVMCNSRNEILSLIDPLTRFRLKFYTPMLAERYDALKPAEQAQIFNSKDWFFTEKQNGVRGILVHHKGQTKLFSRNYSDADCSLPEYWSNIDQEWTLAPGEEDQTYVIDVEIKFEPNCNLTQADLEKFDLPTDSRLEAMVALLATYDYRAKQIQQHFKTERGFDLITFRLIAPLFFKGVNYMSRTIGDGKKVYKDCIQFGQSHGLNVKPIRHCNGTKEEKEIFLDSIIQEGGEGIVAHNIQSPYVTTENRSKQGFIKLKRSVGAQAKKQGLSDTIDGWFTGNFKLGTEGTQNEGLISALEVATHVIKPDGSIQEKVIAWVPNIPRELKILITKLDEFGNIYIDPSMVNKCCEVDGQNFSKVSHQLTHPRLIRMRDDKTPDECYYTEDFILAQVD